MNPTLSLPVSIRNLMVHGHILTRGSQINMMRCGQIVSYCSLFDDLLLTFSFSHCFSTNWVEWSALPGRFHGLPTLISFFDLVSKYLLPLHEVAGLPVDDYTMNKFNTMSEIMSMMTALP